MEKLIEELKRKIEKSKYKEILSDDVLDNLYNVYPFNKFEYIISHIIEEHLISIEDYYNIRDNYIRRNKFLYLFEINAPRAFGEKWAQNHLNELVQELERPSKELDPEYNWQYDFWYKGIRIEVKASRAVDKESDEELVMKALATNSSKCYNMNFQQIKPRCCDVFVWIAVWRDAIKYWVFASNEIETNKYFSIGQHRGNIGEGQLWIKETNIEEFNNFLVEPKNILEKIIEKNELQQSIINHA